MIYFDNNATTVVCPEAQKIWSELSSLPLNESSIHRLGQQARLHLHRSVALFRRYFAHDRLEILFTSGATEAINTFFANFSSKKEGGHILVGVTEHSAILQALKKWIGPNWVVDWLPVDSEGNSSLESIREKLLPETKLVVLMATNNETGTNQNLVPLGSLLASKGIELFVDAVAATGRSPFRWFEGLTASVISGHKFHAPLGVGLLALVPDHSLTPLLVGGPQQRGRRAGTIPLPLLTAMATALEVFMEREIFFLNYMNDLRNYFESQIQKIVANVEINGSKNRSSNVSNLFFKGIEAETLVMQLDQAGILVSQGSACQAGAVEPSYVVRSMHSLERAKSSVRFSFSRMNSLEEIERSLPKIKEAVDFQRSLR